MLEYITDSLATATGTYFLAPAAVLPRLLCLYLEQYITGLPALSPRDAGGAATMKTSPIFLRRHLNQQGPLTITCRAESRCALRSPARGGERGSLGAWGPHDLAGRHEHPAVPSPSAAAGGEGGERSGAADDGAASSITTEHAQG